MTSVPGRPLVDLAQAIEARVAELTATVARADADIDYSEERGELAGLTWVLAKLSPLMPRRKVTEESEVAA